MITKDQIEALFPRGQRVWINALADLWPELHAYAGVTTPNRIYMMLAMVGTETDGLSITDMKEDIRYKPARAAKIFSYRLRRARLRIPRYKRFSSNLALAKHVCHPNYHAFMNIVYGGREGTPRTQGWKYIGRGPSQITHLDNYRAIMALIRAQPGGQACPDLIENPDALLDPEWGTRALFADWMEKGLNRTADTGYLLAVRKHLNTGSAHSKIKPHGMPAARKWLKQAKRIIPIATLGAGRAPEIEDEPLDGLPMALGCNNAGLVRHAQEELEALGYNLPGGADGSYGRGTEGAVMMFQKRNGQPVTGEISQADYDLLISSDAVGNDVPRDREAATMADMRANGSTDIQRADVNQLVGGLTVAGGTAKAVNDAGLIDKVSGWVSMGEQVNGLLASIGALLGQYWWIAAVAGGVVVIKNGSAQKYVRLAKHQLGLDQSR